MNLIVKTLITGALLASASTMSFADNKTFPSSMCEARDQESAKHLRYGHGRVLNTSGSEPASVVCPVVRTNTTNTNGTAFAYVFGRSNGSDPLTCTFYSRSRFGELLQPIAQSVTTDSSASNLNITLTLDVNLSQLWGMYEIQCKLPPRGMLNSYAVREF